MEDVLYRTKRLVLTHLGPNWAEQVLHFYTKNKEHFEPFEPDRDPEFYTLQFQKLALSMEYRLMIQGKLFRLWIFEKDNPEVIIGSVNFYNITYGVYCTCQIGYKLDCDYTGRGYAYESIKTGIQIFHKKHQNIRRIEANIMPSNIPSIHLIEKLGFEYEGYSKSNIRIRYNWEDHLRYSFLIN